MRPIEGGRPVLAVFNPSDSSQDPAAIAGLPQQPAISETDPGQAASAGTAPAQLADPLLKSLAQLELNQYGAAAPAVAREDWNQAGVGHGVLYTKQGAIGVSTAPPTKQTSISVPPEVAELLAEGAKNPEAKKEFTAAQQALAAGDYTAAHQALESLMRKQGEDVLTDDQVKSTQTVRDQLGLLSDMQKAGVKADYPPTEAQLVSYFKTLKNKPAAARDAFETYTQNFHIHPGRIPGEKSDIQYSHEKVVRGNSEYITDVPHKWSDVSSRPAKGSQYAGKQMNDCQGFAFMGEKLLGAAGFKVTHNITVDNGTQSDHAMVMFTHPKEKSYTVVSDDKTYQGNTQKAAAQRAFEDVVGQGKLTGKEHFYIGKTQTDAEIEGGVKNNEL